MDHEVGCVEITCNSISWIVAGEGGEVGRDEVVALTSSCSLEMSLIVSSRTDSTSDVGVGWAGLGSIDGGLIMVKDVSAFEEGMLA